MGTTDETKPRQRQFSAIPKGWKLMFLAFASWAIALGVLYLALGIYRFLIG